MKKDFNKFIIHINGINGYFSLDENKHELESIKLNDRPKCLSILVVLGIIAISIAMLWFSNAEPQLLKKDLEVVNAEFLNFKKLVFKMVFWISVLSLIATVVISSNRARTKIATVQEIKEIMKNVLKDEELFEKVCGIEGKVKELQESVKNSLSKEENLSAQIKTVKDVIKDVKELCENVKPSEPNAKSS